MVKQNRMGGKFSRDFIISGVFNPWFVLRIYMLVLFLALFSTVTFKLAVLTFELNFRLMF